MVNEAAQGKKDELNDLLNNKYSDLREAVLGAGADVTDSAKQEAQGLKELKETATERAKGAAEKVDRKAHEDPWKTLGWAVAGAFAIGFLLGRKD